MVQYLGTETVDGSPCDNLLAVLKPGIGNSVEDRVVISIDHDHHWVRRVRITVDGLESTRGAVADIYLRDHIRIGGILWPTTFYEELKRPFGASVHRWRLTAIDYDRRLERSSIDGPTFTGAASRPAGRPQKPDNAADIGVHFFENYDKFRTTRVANTKGSCEGKGEGGNMQLKSP
jgi:hypothetical protein